MLSLAAERGCNFIDTADRYGAPGSAWGTAESIIGRWMSGQRRDRFVVATKARGRMGPGPNDEGLSRHHLLLSIDASLNRLRTDYIDLLLMHWPDPETPLDETLRALDDLVSQGKVRYVGCSNFPAWLVAKALWLSDINGWAPVVASQTEYSLVHRAEYERELMHLCIDQAVGTVAYRPLAEGFLTGKYDPSRKPETSARASIRPEVSAYFTDANFSLLSLLNEVAKTSECTVSQVALSWVLKQPGICATTVGARTLAQLRESLGAAEVSVTANDLSLLDRASSWHDDRTLLARPRRSRGE